MHQCHRLGIVLCKVHFVQQAMLWNCNKPSCAKHWNPAACCGTYLAGAGLGKADAAGPHAAQHAARAAVVGRHDDGALHEQKGRVSCMQQHDQTVVTWVHPSTENSCLHSGLCI